MKVLVRNLIFLLLSLLSISVFAQSASGWEYRHLGKLSVAEIKSTTWIEGTAMLNDQMVVGIDLIIMKNLTKGYTLLLSTESSSFVKCTDFCALAYKVDNSKWESISISPCSSVYRVIDSGKFLNSIENGSVLTLSLPFKVDGQIKNAQFVVSGLNLSKVTNEGHSIHSLCS